MPAGADARPGSRVRTAVSIVAAFSVVVGAFLVLAWPALEPDDKDATLGGTAASTSLTELVPPQLPTRGASLSPGERRSKHVLTNGCSYSVRGIPTCGVLLGAAYGSNTEPLEWERSMGHPLGVRRTYWDATDVEQAASTAQQDLRRQRLPWMSFKLPHSWDQMRDGLGDSWARGLAQRMALVDGPVWLAFHHEPEGDGDIQSWKATQERLAPIVRAAAPNVAYTIILTGWNQLYGDAQYSFSSVWPEGTAIDVVGFDVYDKYGVERNGSPINLPTDFEGHYFAEFRRFAEEKGVAWALAETGHTDRSADVRDDWVLRTYLSVLKYEGVAFSYFNSTQNSIAPWHLTGTKEEEFAKTLRMTPTL
jgi:hypothetical protein